MNLLQLKYFQEVARYQNISKAAAALHISQPSLSVSIKHLEEELGLSLFDRKGRSITLNDNGTAFLRDINSVFELLNRNKRKQELLSSGKKDSIVIGSRNSELSLSSFIQTFLSRHPDVTIILRNTTSIDTFDPDILDFLIYTKPADSAPKSRRLVLAPYRHCILMASSHPLAKRQHLTPQELSGESFIFVAPKPDIMPPGYRILSEYGISPSISCLTDERIQMLSLMSESRYISVIPEPDAKVFVQIGNFRAIPLKTEVEKNIVLSFESSFSRPFTPICLEFLRELYALPEIRARNPDFDPDRL